MRESVSTKESSSCISILKYINLTFRILNKLDEIISSVNKILPGLWKLFKWIFTWQKNFMKLFSLNRSLCSDGHDAAEMLYFLTIWVI